MIILAKQKCSFLNLQGFCNTIDASSSSAQVIHFPDNNLRMEENGFITDSRSLKWRLIAQGFSIWIFFFNQFNV